MRYIKLQMSIYTLPSCNTVRTRDPTTRYPTILNFRQVLLGTDLFLLILDSISDNIQFPTLTGHFGNTGYHFYVFRTQDPTLDILEGLFDAIFPWIWKLLEVICIKHLNENVCIIPFFSPIHITEIAVFIEILWSFMFCLFFNCFWSHGKSNIIKLFILEFIS